MLWCFVVFLRSFVVIWTHVVTGLPAALLSALLSVQVCLRQVEGCGTSMAFFK